MTGDGQIAVGFQAHQAVGAREGDGGTGLDVGDRAWVETGLDGILSVEVTSQNYLEAVAGEYSRHRLIVVDHVIREKLLLSSEMLQEPLVHHAEDAFALAAGRRELVGDPDQPSRVEVAAIEGRTIGIALVAAGVHRQEPEARRW